MPGDGRRPRRAMGDARCGASEPGLARRVDNGAPVTNRLGMPHSGGQCMGGYRGASRGDCGWIVRALHRNPPDDGQGNGPGHREVWIKDPDGYTVVIASPDGGAYELAEDPVGSWRFRPPRTCGRTGLRRSSARSGCVDLASSDPADEPRHGSPLRSDTSRPMAGVRGVGVESPCCRFTATRLRDTVRRSPAEGVVVRAELVARIPCEAG
jgi:hypothetical protein